MSLSTDLQEILTILKCNQNQYKMIEEIIQRIKANYGDEDK